MEHTEQLRVRAAPSLSSVVLGHLRRGEVVWVLGDDSDDHFLNASSRPGAGIGGDASWKRVRFGDDGDCEAWSLAEQFTPMTLVSEASAERSGLKDSERKDRVVSAVAEQRVPSLKHPVFAPSVDPGYWRSLLGIEYEWRSYLVPLSHPSSVGHRFGGHGAHVAAHCSAAMSSPSGFGYSYSLQDATVGWTFDMDARLVECVNHLLERRGRRLVR